MPVGLQMLIVHSTTAYKTANPDEEASAVSKHAKAEEEAARKQAATVVCVKLLTPCVLQGMS